MKKVFIIFFLVAILFKPAVAYDFQEVDRLIRTTVNTVLEISRAKDLNEELKKEQIMAVVTRVFNLPLMAKLTLGRRHWKELNGEQREEFTNLFIKQMQSTYLGKVEIAADAKVQFEEPFGVNTKIHMKTRAMTKDEPIKILYKLYKSGEKWRVYDVEIQDVSIVKSYGMQYSQILQTGTYEDLLGKMKEKIQQSESEVPPKK
jgi:phospholipid transport system substrate-binding protein